MRDEDASSSLHALLAREQALRLKASQFAATFDTFQDRLADCSSTFSTRQAATEALQQETLALEKQNAACVKRVGECVASTKVASTIY